MSKAAEAIAAGGCAIIATDTVYGLAALPASAGYERIFELKGRPRGQVLPWLVDGVEMLEDVAADVPAWALRLARMLWPGALTLVVRAGARARATQACADDGTVAVRCPADAACLELIGRLGRPVACTSANGHGEPAASRLADVSAAFRGVPGYRGLPGSCPGGTASTIVDCTGRFPNVLREGPVPAHVIWDVAVFDDTLV